MHDHSGHEAAWFAGLGPLILPGALALVAVAYCALAARSVAHRPVPWSRVAWFVGGTAITLWGLVGSVSRPSPSPFTVHMVQHLAVGMLGPLCLMMGAPVTLLLRNGPRGLVPVVRRLLRSRVLRFVSHPITALVLSVGTLPVLNGTRLYAWTEDQPGAADLLHLHLLLSGALFAWVICGPDPAPHRPSVPVRLVVLGVAVATHATTSQVLYAGALPILAEPADLRMGATLMYYGGDAVELLMALLLVTAWKPRRRRSTAWRDAESSNPGCQVQTTGGG